MKTVIAAAAGLVLSAGSAYAEEKLSAEDFSASNDKDTQCYLMYSEQDSFSYLPPKAVEVDSPRTCFNVASVYSAEAEVNVFIYENSELTNALACQRNSCKVSTTQNNNQVTGINNVDNPASQCFVSYKTGYTEGERTNMNAFPVNSVKQCFEIADITSDIVRYVSGHDTIAMHDGQIVNGISCAYGECTPLLERD